MIWSTFFRWTKFAWKSGPNNGPIKYKMTLVKKKEKPLKISGYLLKGWSSRESNPGPNTESICFLHA